MAKKGAKKGKKTPRNKPTSKKYTKYKLDGDKVTRQPTCPRCGPGIFLMIANNRKYCGKCHFTEFDGKKPETPKEDKPEEKKE
jgi:small subunit ribosomal protein S27Ae|tara:strand:+ start:433 stop:681 length:249 start_codon:yes stop_codon:yes gene_type:complete